MIDFDSVLVVADDHMSTLDNDAMICIFAELSGIKGTLLRTE